LSIGGMGALLRARAGVGGRPGGPRDTHWTVQEGPEEARPSHSRHTPPLRRRLVALGSARVRPSAVRHSHSACCAGPGGCLGWGQFAACVRVVDGCLPDCAPSQWRGRAVPLGHTPARGHVC